MYRCGWKRWIERGSASLGLLGGRDASGRVWLLSLGRGFLCSLGGLCLFGSRRGLLGSWGFRLGAGRGLRVVRGAGGLRDLVRGSRLRRRGSSIICFSVDFENRAAIAGSAVFVVGTHVMEACSGAYERCTVVIVHNLAISRWGSGNVDGDHIPSRGEGMEIDADPRGVDRRIKIVQKSLIYAAS